MQDHTHIQISGVRVHNLKNLTLSIPLQKISCLMGPSGSGKTSLAFHTLLSESKRRFLMALPSSMKLFNDNPAPVDVDEIAPVLPVFGLQQYNPVLTARPVVADTLGLTDHLQAYFALKTSEHCSQHLVPLEQIPPHEQVTQQVKVGDEDIVHLFVEKELFIVKLGLSSVPTRSSQQQHGTAQPFSEDHEFWELGRFKGKNLADIKKYLFIGEKCLFPTFYVGIKGATSWHYIQLSEKAQCRVCHEGQVVEKNSQLFSPYNGFGACSSCHGFGATLEFDESKYLDREKSLEKGALLLWKSTAFAGQKKEFERVCELHKINKKITLQEQPESFWKLLYQGYKSFDGLEGLFAYLKAKQYKPAIKMVMRGLQSEKICNVCAGTRLNRLNERFLLGETKKYSLMDIMKLSAHDLLHLFETFRASAILPTEITLLKKMQHMLAVTCEFGLGHLPLLRKTKTVSGGEYQKLLLVKFFSFEGTDSLFILDEPSVGVAPDQYPALWRGIELLKKQGNTVIIIEHQEFFQERSDHLLKLGPGSGAEGGELLYAGPWHKELAEPMQTVEISALEKISPKKAKLLLEIPSGEVFKRSYAAIKFYQNAVHLITGPSGSGKSAWCIKSVANRLYYEQKGEWLYDKISDLKEIKYHGELSDVIITDINLKRYNSRSSVGSFTELASVLRKHYASTQEAQLLGLSESHFSTNNELGQCPECQGKGKLIIDMQYLEDVIMGCELCKGSGFKQAVAQLSDGRLTVAQGFNQPLQAVFSHLSLTPKFKRIMDALLLLRLGHLSLERQMSSLSGGEKQRLNLISYVLKKPENAILFFENITFGLSPLELKPLAEFIISLKKAGNTVVVIDHHPMWQSIKDIEYQMPACL
jgi:excinuclease ABC subunit A